MIKLAAWVRSHAIAAPSRPMPYLLGWGSVGGRWVGLEGLGWGVGAGAAAVGEVLVSARSEALGRPQRQAPPHLNTNMYRKKGVSIVASSVTSISGCTTACAER